MGIIPPSACMHACSEQNSDHIAMGKSIIIISLLACIGINCQLGNANSRDAYLIVGLPFQCRDDSVAIIWERGEEILPGAEIAVKNINRRPDLLPDETLHIVVVDIGGCGQQNNQNFLLEFVNLTFHQHLNIIGAIGIFCPTEVQIITPPVLLGTSNSSAKEVLKLATKASYTANIGKYQRIIEALIEFFDVLGWRNVAAITDNGDNFFFHVIEKLTMHKTSASVYNGSIVIYNYAQGISQLDLPRIILVSIRAPLAIELLCNAHRENLMWPKHVWILHTHYLQEIANLSTPCNIEQALENVLIINEDIPIPIHFTENYKKYMPSYQHDSINPYSYVLNELVWSVALATNGTLLSKTMWPNRGIKVVQVKNFSEILVAMYSDQLTFSDPIFIASAPSDKLLMIFEGATSVYTAICIIAIIGSFIFVTVMLLGYSFFRYEPEIKSTSFSLSLLVFLGCYLLFIYLSILLYFHQPSDTSNQTLDILCISLNWFSGLGVPTALILVTSLVKTLRIYYIFNKPIATELSKTCSDIYLVIYVILIMSPLIFLHTLWTIVDPYLGSLKTIAELNTIRYQKECKSTHTMLWYSLLAVYLITIFSILVVVAVRMRRIQKSHFNDTKKVIILVSCYFLDLILALACWRVLYAAVNAYMAAIVLHIGHFTVIVLCQVFLFVPKVVPPLIRYIKKFKHPIRNDNTIMSFYHNY